MESDKHILDVESCRNTLLCDFNIAVFKAETERNNLPSSNPINVYLVDYWKWIDFDIKKIEKFWRLKNFLHPLFFFLVTVFIFGGIQLVLQIVGLGSYANTVTELYIAVFYILLLVNPGIYWTYGLYKTITLIFYTDFLKKHVLNELNLLILYYDLLLRVAKPSEEETEILKNGKQQMEEFGNSFSKPKLFRNLTLGSLSSGTGLLGIITTVVAQDYPLIGQISFEGYWLLENPSFWNIVLALVIPWIIVPTLVIVPLILGIRGAAIYANENFWETEKKLRKLRERSLWLYKRMGDYQKVKDFYQKALKNKIIETGKKLRKLTYLLGLYEWMGADRKKKDFEKFLKINPENAIILCNLGETHMQLGELDNAKFWYRYALEIDPENNLAASKLVAISGKPADVKKLKD